MVSITGWRAFDGGYVFYITSYQGNRRFSGLHPIPDIFWSVYTNFTQFQPFFQPGRFTQWEKQPAIK
jgi:hypothetical protein